MLRSVRRYALHLAMTFALAGAISTSAVAQNNAGVDQFLANPAQVLTQFPNGGPRLISLVRDTAIAHPEALQALINLMKTASPAQQLAFGSGFGQAAQIVSKTDETYANQIRAAVAGSGSDRANTAMNGVTGDVAIASVGGAGGGGGGGSGGTAGGGSGSGGPTGGSNTGTGQVFGSNSSQTSQQTFTGGGAGVSGSSSSSGRVSPR